MSIPAKNVAEKYASLPVLEALAGPRWRQKRLSGKPC